MKSPQFVQVSAAQSVGRYRGEANEGQACKVGIPDSRFKREQHLEDLCNDGGSSLGCKLHAVVRLTAHHAPLAAAL